MYSTRLFRLLLLPIIHPLRDSIAVAFNVFRLLAGQLHHDFFIERLLRFLKKYAEYFRIQVFL